MLLIWLCSMRTAAPCNSRGAACHTMIVFVSSVLHKHVINYEVRIALGAVLFCADHFCGIPIIFHVGMRVTDQGNGHTWTCGGRPAQSAHCPGTCFHNKL